MEPAFRTSRRRGVSLIELAIVVAIFGVLAALGAFLMNPTVPAWRTRQAAMDFAADVSRVRQLALAEGVEYRVRMVLFDSDPDGDSENAGIYEIARGNYAVDSDQWDVLPTETGGADASQSEGYVEISNDGEDQVRNVSIGDWTLGTTAPDSNFDIIFDSRGFVTNPATDFCAKGSIEITFVNKVARRRGTVDDRKVKIYRSGMVEVEASRDVNVVNSAGTADATNFVTSSGSGHEGGGDSG